MDKPKAFTPEEGAERVSAVMDEAARRVAGMQLPADALLKIQQEYLKGAMALWNQGLAAGDGAGQAPIGDRRFASKEWADNPAAAFAAACTC